MTKSAYKNNTIFQVWILACIVFVFITVLEYTYILFMMRRVKKKILNHSNREQKVKTQQKRESFYPPEMESVSAHSKRSSVIPFSADHSSKLKKLETNGKFLLPRGSSTSQTNEPSKLFIFCNNLWEKFRELIRKFWSLFEDRFEAPPSEVELQILMTNIDYTFVWIVIILFLVFNAVYWSWNRT